MRLRVIRRLSSFEGTPEQAVRVEFTRRTGGPDLALSVYRVQPDQVLRVLAEHACSLLNPPSRVESADLEGLWTEVVVRPTPGETEFSFANERHAECLVESEGQLLELVGRLCQNIQACSHVRDRAALVGYARQRVTEGDPEWERALRRVGGGTRWAKLVNKES